MRTEPMTYRGIAARALLVAWALGGIVLGAVLLAPHVAGLPLPSEGDPRLTAAMSEPAPGSWLVEHFVLTGCDCSRRIVETLRARPPHAGVAERVVLIGRADGDDPVLRALGYAVEAVTPGELRGRFGLEAAPVFAVRDPMGAVRHVGGYTSHRRGPALQDRDVLAALLGGGDSAALPVFGCATSARLRAATDPLSIGTGPDPAELARLSTPEGRP